MKIKRLYYGSVKDNQTEYGLPPDCIVAGKSLGILLSLVHAKRGMTLRELADIYDIKTPNGVKMNIQRLVRLGLVDVDPGVARSIRTKYRRIA